MQAAAAGDTAELCRAVAAPGSRRQCATDAGGRRARSWADCRHCRRPHQAGHRDWGRLQLYQVSHGLHIFTNIHFAVGMAVTYSRCVAEACCVQGGMQGPVEVAISDVQFRSLIYCSAQNCCLLCAAGCGWHLGCSTLAAGELLPRFMRCCKIAWGSPMSNSSGHGVP